MQPGHDVSPVGFVGKVVVLLVLLTADLVMNTLVDFEDSRTLRKKDCSGGVCIVLPAILFGVQVALQCINFLVFFLLLSATFPFRVGLVAPLMKMFRPVLYITPLYMLMTLGHGVFRLSYYVQGRSIADLWQSPLQKVLFTVRFAGNTMEDSSLLELDADELAMLKELNRLIPIPALRSGAVRLASKQSLTAAESKCLEDFDMAGSAKEPSRVVDAVARSMRTLALEEKVSDVLEDEGVDERRGELDDSEVESVPEVDDLEEGRGLGVSGRAEASPEQVRARYSSALAKARVGPAAGRDRPTSGHSTKPGFASETIRLRPVGK